MTAPIRKRCKSCRKYFTPERPMQTTCSFQCAIEYSKRPKAKKAYIMQGKKLLKEKYPDTSKLIKKAQLEVNKYVRLRDKNKPCCTCGHIEGRQFHAGHYESAGGNHQQRFYTLNIHRQCSICNNHKSGNLAAYKEFMIKKYGLEKTEVIENDHSTKKYSAEYLERLIKVFRKKIRLYERKFR